MFIKQTPFIILFVTLLFFSLNCNAQEIHPSNSKTDSLEKKYGKQKIIIPAYKLPILNALSHYPELQDIVIIFKETNMESTGKTTILFPTIFCKSKRKYIIYINKNSARTGFILKDLNSSEQEAVFGHELAHVVNFNTRSFMGMLFWGITYLNKNKRVNIERSTDISTIDHGLRKELLEWSNFVLNSPLTTNAYKKMRRRYYLVPEEILAHNNP